MGFFKNLTKTVLNIAISPIDIAKDIITMGGAMTDEYEPYTMQRLKKIGKNLEKTVNLED